MPRSGRRPRRVLRQAQDEDASNRWVDLQVDPWAGLKSLTGKQPEGAGRLPHDVKGGLVPPIHVTVMPPDEVRMLSDLQAFGAFRAVVVTGMDGTSLSMTVKMQPAILTSQALKTDPPGGVFRSILRDARCAGSSG